MPIPSKPSMLNNVLGHAADVTTIPDTTPTGTGEYSYQSGFPQITQIPLTAGGVAPRRVDFNALFNLLSQHTYFQQSGCLYDWSVQLNYLPGAHVLGSNGTEYKCLTLNGPDVASVGAKDPTQSANSAYWIATTEEGAYSAGTGISISGQRVISTNLTAGNGISISGATIATNLAAGNGITISGTSTRTIATNLAAGTGISISGTSQRTIAINLTAGDGISISGNTISAINAGVPIGGIMMFSGSFGGTGNRFPIPAGSSSPDTNWCLCDGTTTSGVTVPDLRDKFIIGAGNEYASGTTGGSTNHSHSITGAIGATTLSVGQMPSHTHSIYGGARDCGYSSNPDLSFVEIHEFGTSGATGGNQSHTHSLDNMSTSSTRLLPPYYALSYIMRIK